MLSIEDRGVNKDRADRVIAPGPWGGRACRESGPLEVIQIATLNFFLCSKRNDKK